MSHETDQPRSTEEQLMERYFSALPDQWRGIAAGLIKKGLEEPDLTEAELVDRVTWDVVNTCAKQTPEIQAYV